MAKLSNKDVKYLLSLTPYARIYHHFLNKTDSNTIKTQKKLLRHKCKNINECLIHNLRNYQYQALMYFMYAQETHKIHPEYNFQNLLFDMATGSGKTDLMAGIILYMNMHYGINKFIYTIPYTEVLQKTYDNFIDSNSRKFLFKSNPLKIKTKDNTEKLINIVNVPNLSDKYCNQKDTIYICLQDIQSIRSVIKSPKENGLTLNDLKNQNVVILEDEAHHYNGNTKKNRIDSKLSYEKSLNCIQNSCKNCWQLGFTATPNQNRDPQVGKKDSQDIIFRYTLNKFMSDKYSKRIYNIATSNSHIMPLPEGISVSNYNKIDEDDVRRMIDAVIISQARVNIAKRHQITNFRPIILFHANQIKRSLRYTKLFNNIIDKLTPKYLKTFISIQYHAFLNSNNKNYLITLVYKDINNYNRLQLKKFCDSIKQAFNPDNVINVNDNKVNPSVLNHLEDPNVTTRAIFEVNKLNEGWDVLNLFDIVRLDDNMSGSTSTNREVQLIGRGSRYYPFYYSRRGVLQTKEDLNNSSRYRRCFDNLSDTNSNQDVLLKLLESLLYHTKYDNNYIKNLKKSYNANHIIVQSNQSKLITAHVKSSFKSDSLYRKGYLYMNMCKVHYPEDNISPLTLGLPIWNSDNTKSFMNNISIDCSNRIKVSSINNISSLPNTYPNNVLKSFHMNYNITNKILEVNAMSEISFYDFNNLHKYLPKVNSLKEFMKQWLPQIKFEIIETNKQPAPQLEFVITQFLLKLSKEIKKLYYRIQGTKFFYPVPVKDIVKNYQKMVNKTNVSSPNAGDKNYGSMNQNNQKWFVYDTKINDSELENNFIINVGNLLNNHFNYKFTNHLPFLMIRNDGTQKSDLFLHSKFVNYMPDYILIFRLKNKIYELFAEPKDINYLDESNSHYSNTINKDKLLHYITPNNICIVKSLPKGYCERHNTLIPKIVNKKNYNYFTFDGESPVTDQNNKPIKIKNNSNAKNIKIYGLRFYLRENPVYPKKWIETARKFNDIKVNNNKDQLNLFNLK